jgi:hypothetical protein
VHIDKIPLRGLMSSGPSVNVARHVGEEAVASAMRQ